MNKGHRVLAGGALVAGMSLGSAAPASAEEPVGAEAVTVRRRLRRRRGDHYQLARIHAIVCQSIT